MKHIRPKRNLPSAHLIDILSHTHIAVATFDPLGECTFCSKLLADLLQLDPENMDEFVGALSDEEDTQHHLLRTFESVWSGKQEPRAEVSRQLGNGTTCIYTVEALMYGEGSDAELAVVLKDTSNEMNLRRDLEQIGRLAALGQITAGVAHEFNNILTSMLGWAQIAGQDIDPLSVTFSALEIIEGNAKRAKEIASRLLGVSRPVEDSHSSFSVVAAIEEVLKLLSWEMSNAGIQVVRSFKSDGLCWGDDNRISQVFINIVRNAMDAMPDGGTLHVAVHQIGDQLEISFTDTGPGMEQTVLEQIFDPFFTTKRCNDKSTLGGTGLGLAICRDILEEHRGRISVKSSPSKGTYFAIMLPITDQPSEPIDNDKDSRTTIPPGVSVLVADDEPDIGEMIRTSLELKGANVIAVNSGEEAVALCRDNHFDLAFIDFSMPGLSGHRLGREMFRNHPDLPIIFMSGREVEMDREMPIADFLKKPFDLDDILRKLREVLKPNAAD
ncbi:MAG: response regulator [Proteobacteria bacterium]|nr:response regulator [Pseudomonadota bacterium]